MIYLSSNTRQFFEYGHDYFGCMFNITRRVGRQLEALHKGCWWMVDNGNFSGKWTLASWLLELRHMRPWRGSCLGVPVPDKVGDWRETVNLFMRYAEYPQQMGYPVAFVSQDGQPFDRVPWDQFDTLFIGGTNEHKRGLEAECLGLAAKRHGKWVHVGRVNSGSAGALYWPWADSWDGTTFSHHPTQQVGSIMHGVQLANQELGYQRKLL